MNTEAGQQWPAAREQTMRSRQQTNQSRHQRGAVAIIFGLTLAVLIGFAGLAIDLGRFFVIKSELQNAMDSCALAAASQLRPGQNNATALTKAIAYGRVFSTGGADNIGAIKNRANFQSTVIDIQADQITFADTLDGAYLTAGGADYNTAAFAKCSFPLANLPIFFMKILNPLLTTQTVSGMAVATLAPSSSACAIPIAACKVPGTTAASNFGLTVGQWLSPPVGPGSPYGTGNFGWIDFSPPGGGASELADLLTGPGQCGAGIGTVVGEPGAISSLDVAWNSRFGLYKPGGGNPQKETAAPDVTGFGYTTATWPSGSNAYNGAGSFNYVDAASNYRPYQVNPPNPYNRLTSAQHNSFGRFRRLVVAPVVDCSTWNVGGANPTVEGWACVLMLNPLLATGDVPSIEFRGLSTAVGSPCSTNGEPGTFGPLVPQLVQ
jgi:Flp pilus assembly protein TadG